MVVNQHVYDALKESRRTLLITPIKKHIKPKKETTMSTPKKKILYYYSC